MEKERSIQRIVITVVWQSVLSLLIGIGIFYLAAPHSTDHGTLIIEPILLLILLCTGFVIAIALKFIFKNRVTFLCFVFYAAGVIGTQQYYPIQDRIEEPSPEVEKEIRIVLERQFGNIERISINNRGKRLFDLLRPKEWVVILYTEDDPHHKRLYIRESIFGKFSLIK
ncbi:MAG: hypothetical protein HUJ16_10435 [Kangiella sp.]|nr:hypothetical protein [Kangiella sp.]